MPRNVELKSRLPEPEETVSIAREIAGPPTVERQVDTYFRVPSGRLKLRRRWIEEDEQPAELIAYRRPDDVTVRTSRYRIVRFDPGPGLIEVLSLARDIEVEVEKTRRVFLHDDVRIHVDEVAGLGSFLEFEALVSESCDEASAAAKVRGLTRRFGIREEDRVAGSYRELAAERSPPK